jgi:hypothetical protein
VGIQLESYDGQWEAAGQAHHAANQRLGGERRCFPTFHFLYIGSQKSFGYGAFLQSSAQAGYIK